MIFKRFNSNGGCGICFNYGSKNFLTHFKLLSLFELELVVRWALQNQGNCRSHLEHANAFTFTEKYAIRGNSESFEGRIGGLGLFKL